MAQNRRGVTRPRAILPGDPALWDMQKITPERHPHDRNARAAPVPRTDGWAARPKRQAGCLPHNKIWYIGGNNRIHYVL